MLRPSQQIAQWLRQIPAQMHPHGHQPRTAGRLDAQSFAVVASGTGRVGAARLAERLREAIATLGSGAVSWRIAVTEVR